MQDKTQTHTELNRETVAERAYQLWEAAGRPAGRDLEHWLQAEEELFKANRLHRAEFEAADSNVAHAIAPAKGAATPTAILSRRGGSRGNSAVLERGDRRGIGSRIR